MSANKIANTQSRALRTISIVLLTVLAFTGVAFVIGATSFKLGLDLQGGTSVTLQPRIEAGQAGKVTSESIDQAVAIIRQRVNSLGVAESEVSAQGTGVNRQIIISVPGETGRRIVDLVGQTAELRFRPVLAEGAASATTVSPDAANTTLPSPCKRMLWLHKSLCSDQMLSPLHGSAHANDLRRTQKQEFQIPWLRLQASNHQCS